MKNKVLMTITAIMYNVLLICCGAADCGSWISYAGVCVSLAWIALFVYANRERFMV